MVEASLIYGAVQTVGILIGVMIAVFEIRHMRIINDLSLKAQEQALDTRQAQLFMEIYNHFNKQEFKNQVINVRFQ